MGADGASAVTTTERETETIDIVRFVLLDETGPHDVLLFGCKRCPSRKLTSHQLESHMKVHHGASKFTVDTAMATRNRSRKPAAS